MKNFFKNLKSYAVLIIATLVAVVVAFQYVQMMHVLTQVNGLSTLFAFELTLAFVVGLMFFTGWYINILNSVLKKPLSTKVANTLKLLVNAVVSLFAGAFVCWELVVAFIAFVKAGFFLYSLEILALLVIVIVFAIRYFRKEYIRIITPDTPF